MSSLLYNLPSPSTRFTRHFLRQTTLTLRPTCVLLHLEVAAQDDSWRVSGVPWRLRLQQSLEGRGVVGVGEIGFHEESLLKLLIKVGA